MFNQAAPAASSKTWRRRARSKTVVDTSRLYESEVERRRHSDMQLGVLKMDNQCTISNQRRTIVGGAQFNHVASCVYVNCCKEL